VKGQNKHESRLKARLRDGHQYLGQVPKTGSVVTWEQETHTCKQTARKSKWKWEALAAPGQTRHVLGGENIKFQHTAKI